MGGPGWRVTLYLNVFMSNILHTFISQSIRRDEIWKIFCFWIKMASYLLIKENNVNLIFYSESITYMFVLECSLTYDQYIHLIICLFLGLFICLFCDIWFDMIYEEKTELLFLTLDYNVRESLKMIPNILNVYYGLTLSLTRLRSFYYKLA